MRNFLTATALIGSVICAATEAPAVTIIDHGTDSTLTWGIDWRIWAEGLGAGKREGGRQPIDYLNEETYVYLISPGMADELVAYSRAEGNLATGRIAASSYVTLSQFQGRAETFVTLFDQVYFDLRHMDTSEIVEIPFSARLTGTLSSAPRPPSATFVLSIMGSNDIGSGSAARVQDRYISPGTAETATVANWGLDGIWDRHEPGFYDGRIHLSGGILNTLYFTMTLETFNVADFGNTATFRFNTDIPFSSASGVFLSGLDGEDASPGGPAVIPLAGSAWYLLGGLMALGAAVRAKNARRW